MLPKISKQDVTNPNTWIMMFLATVLGGGGATVFDTDDALLAEQAKVTAQREKAQWEQIDKKMNQDDVKDYVRLSIRAECRP